MRLSRELKKKSFQQLCWSAWGGMCMGGHCCGLAEPQLLLSQEVQLLPLQTKQSKPCFLVRQSLDSMESSSQRCEALSVCRAASSKASERQSVVWGSG